MFAEPVTLHISILPEPPFSSVWLRSQEKAAVGRICSYAEIWPEELKGVFWWGLLQVIICLLVLLVVPKLCVNVKEWIFKELIASLENIPANNLFWKELTLLARGAVFVWYGEVSNSSTPGLKERDDCNTEELRTAIHWHLHFRLSTSG